MNEMEIPGLKWQMDEDDEDVAEGYAKYPCGSCGELNEIFIEESIGHSYEIVEDCMVCCKSNVIHLEKEGGRWACWACPENE